MKNLIEKSIQTLSHDGLGSGCPWISISLTQVDLIPWRCITCNCFQMVFDYLCLCVSPTMPRNIFSSVSAPTLLSFRLPNKGHITIHRYPAETFGQTLCYNISLYFTPTQFEIWLQLKEKTLNTFHKESNEWGNHSLLVMHSLAIFAVYTFLTSRSNLIFDNPKFDNYPQDPGSFYTCK